MKLDRAVWYIAVALLAAACGLRQPLPESKTVAVATADGFEQDRKAILAMTGDYRVDFAFDETVVLKRGYERHPAQRSSGHEFVAVLEDSGTRLVLQHILVADNGDVTKHWRQDWEYQQTRLWEYVGNDTWQRRVVAADAVRGTWTQAVWQVDDSPRYAGIGKWTHAGGVSSWTSESEWRPLPRREHTIRSDYDKLIGTNRHTLTPTGWVHEQDNLKIARDGQGAEQALVREAGVNTYTKVTGYDFAAGHAYWSSTKDYWQNVRSAWADLFARNQRVALRKAVDDKPLFEAMFDQAEVLGGKGKPAAELRGAIDKTLRSYIATTTLATAP